MPPSRGNLSGSFYTRLKVLTVGERNKLAVKTSWRTLKSQVKDRYTLKVKDQGKISLGQDFDRGRSSSCSQTAFFPFVCGNGQVNIAWHCCSGSQQISGDNLGRLLVLSKGLLIGINLFIINLIPTGKGTPKGL